MNILVIDGQGGRIGRLFIEGLRQRSAETHIIAVGSNAIATAAMLKAGADEGATVKTRWSITAALPTSSSVQSASCSPTP